MLVFEGGVLDFCVPGHGRLGGDLLSRVLGRSTIGAGGFHGRVRDGIGWVFLRDSHQAVDDRAQPGFGGWERVLMDPALSLCPGDPG